MKSKELELKVISYLKKRGVNFVSGSVSCRGIMKDVELLDGETKDMHVVGFQLPFEMEYSPQICYIYVDAQTDSLELLVTPSTFEILIEDS